MKKRQYNPINLTDQSVIDVVGYSWSSPRQITIRLFGEEHTESQMHTTYYYLKKLYNKQLLLRTGRSSSTLYKCKLKPIFNGQKPVFDLEGFPINTLNRYFKLQYNIFRSAKEISVINNIPLVTMYRYIDIWTELGLVKISDRRPLTKDGKRYNTYKRIFQRATIENGYIQFT